LLRLVLSGAIGVIGVYFLIQGYEQAYNGDNSLFRPDGNSDHYYSAIIGGFAWFAVLLGNRLRLLSWVFVIFVAWWAYGITGDYLKEQYFVFGKDGCPAFIGWAGELHSAVGTFDLCAFVLAAILRLKEIPDWQFFAALVLASVWLFMAAGLG